MDLTEQCVTFPRRDSYKNEKDTCRPAYVFRSSSKLPWLSGSTRRHFPVREATKDEQLGGYIPHIPSISNHTHNMLDMCKYNMASQHNSMTQSIYSLGSEERDITNMGLMTQHTEHTSNKHMQKLNLSE